MKAIFLSMCFATIFVTNAQGSQMRLLDGLDYPSEGYCIDVLGVGETARTDLPLVLHNCLPARKSADRVAEERNGRIYMSAYDACVTAFGVMNVLPGAPVMLRECGVNESFLPSDRFQKFDRTSDDRLRLVGTDLCLVGGENSDRTFRAEHRWRTLTLQPCSMVPLSLSVWK